MNKMVIFDLDGTLLDTIEDLTDSVNDVMQLYHFPQHDTKKCKMMVGNGFRKLITRALPEERQKDEQFIDEVLAQFAKAYHKRYLNKTVPYEGILQMVNELHKNGIQTAVNSNKRSDYTEALVNKFFAQTPMVAVYGERESKGIPKKPDPAAALEIADKYSWVDIGSSFLPSEFNVSYLYGQLEIADKMKLSPAEILYIGDSETDMKTGQNAGMDTIGVAWGFRGAEELKANHATYIAENPEDILKYIL